MRLPGLMANANKKTVIIAGCIIVTIVIIVAAITFAMRSQDDESETEYVNKTVSNVHMVKTITAAGKVTAADAKPIQFNKSKTFKAMNVETNELVSKGQPLFYYTDGSHYDAPSDGIVNSISAPKNGQKADDSNSIKFCNTKVLYLKVLIPEDTINEITKGDAAEIVVNAYPDRKFEGNIVSMKNISTALLAEDKENNNSSEGDDTSDEGGSSDSETGAEGDVDSESGTGSEGESDSDLEGEMESGSGDDGGAYGEKSDAAYYAVNIKFANDGTLKLGMSANTIITISDRTDVMGIPVEAVSFDKNGQAFVYKMNGNDATKVSVETGESDPMNVEILKGLSIGDTIRIEKVNGGK